MGIRPLISPPARAVFLDRDGVVNQAIVRNGKPFPPQTLAEFALAPGIHGAIRQWKESGFLVIVVTNQPDVARGTQSREVVERMHHRLYTELELDEVLVCWHDDRDGCDCRKPRPGLLRDAAARHRIDLGGSYLVGDRWRDIDAGHAAGCMTVLIDCGYGERGPNREPAARVASVEHAADWILVNEREHRNERS